MERISSAQTFFMKRVFPFIWLGGVAVVAVAGISATFFAKQAHAPPFPLFLIPFVMLVFGFLLFRKLLWDLADSVDDCRDYLLVRRGAIEQRVALSNIMNISMSQFTNPPRLTLRLRTAGPLGDEIAFIPKTAAFRFNVFKRNEIAESLIQRIDALRVGGKRSS
jgi:hypothetical protein